MRLRTAALWVALLLYPFTASAQFVASRTFTDTLSSNGDTVEFVNASTYATFKVQTLDSYSGTWEVQCALNGLAYDADAELTLKAADSASTVTSVTDSVGIWEITNAAGCGAIKVVATAGFAASDTVVVISATQVGGGAGGGGGGGGAVTVTDGTDTALVTAGGDLQVTCGTCSGTGVSANEDSAFADAQALAPAGAVRQGTPANTSGTDGDVEPLRINAGRLWTSTVLTDGTDLALIDGSGNLNITGTITANAGTNLNTSALLTTSAHDAALGVAGTADTQVRTIQGIAGMTAVQVADNGGSLTVDGTVTVTDGAGAMNVICDSGCSGGTQFAEDSAHSTGDNGTQLLAVRRATTPTDRSAGATDGDYEPLQVDGNGRVYTNTVLYSSAGAEITPATDVTEDAAETAGGTGPMVLNVRRDTAASSAGTAGDNATFNTDANGLLWTRGMDPCSALAKTYLPINISTATTTEITPSLAGASNHYYVCSINIGPVAGAQNIALVDDDSDNCGSVTSGLAGGTTAGSGWNIAANGGLVLGTGASSIARTNGTNRVLCLVTSAAVQTSGVITVVAAP